ncbi:MAG: tetratricopeptide repeat protein, partial [Myxococcota bacterium]
RLDEANHITQAAAQRIGQRQDPHLQGLLAFTLGKLALESHDTHPQGGELFKRAAELHAEAGEPALEARSLMELALFTGLALGRPDEAMARYMKALDLVRQVDDLHGEAQLWLHVGKLHINQGRHTNSLECYARALELHRKTGNTHEEATVLMRIGALKNELGYYREGLACMMEALAFKERYDAKRWRLLSTIATTHVSLGELREAIAWMERAQQQAEREGVTDSIVLLAQHGHLAMCRGDCATLRSVVDQLTPLAEASSPDSAARIVLLQYASRLALMESTFIQAEELFRQCADMCKEQGRMLFLTYAHTGLSTALCRQGRFDEAEAVLSQSSTPVTQASYAALDTAMTILRLHQSRYQEAANHADKSRIIMERSGNLLNLICVLCWRCLAAHGLDETMEPWLALIRRHTEGLELYSTSEVGQALLAVQAVDPNALPFTFLDDAPQAQV